MHREREGVAVTRAEEEKREAIDSLRSLCRKGEKTSLARAETEKRYGSIESEGVSLAMDVERKKEVISRERVSLNGGEAVKDNGLEGGDRERVQQLLLIKLPRIWQKKRCNTEIQNIERERERAKTLLTRAKAEKEVISRS